MAKQANARKDEATSRGTRLGYCLQRIIARCARGAGLREQIHENAQYRPEAIRPDLFLGPLSAPRASVHVTSSDSRDSFRMKRWRYVCELFQLKRVHPGVHSVNVFWGTPDLYQGGDVAFLERLFDSTVDLRHHPEARRLYAAARERADERPDVVAAELFAGASTRLKEDIAESLGRAVAAPVRQANLPMWRAAAKQPAGDNQLPDGRQSTWLPLLLRCLLLTDTEMAALHAHFAGAEPPEAAVRLGIVQRAEGLLAEREWRSPPGLRRAFATGRAEAFRRWALAEARYSRLFEEARDAAEATWVPAAYRALRAGASTAAVRALLRLGETHPRLLALDALAAFFDVAVNPLEALWDESLCRVGVKNPLANLINRTPQAHKALEERDALARGFLHFWEQVELRSNRGAASLAVFSQRLQAYRRQCLFGQKVVKVAPFAARQVFDEQGWREAGKRRFPFSCKATEGLSVASEFELTFEKRGHVILLKALYADTGADHKAEENAGRRFLLPFRLRGQSRVESRPLPGNALFVPEGKWSGEQLDLLASAGWDVVGLEALPSYLDALG